MYLTDLNKNYVKEPKEDLVSIERGIRGDKGNVHISIGSLVKFEHECYEKCSNTISSLIRNSYMLHPTNYAAAILQGKDIRGNNYSENSLDEAIDFLKKKMDTIPEDMHPYLLNQYSNPVSYR